MPDDQARGPRGRVHVLWSDAPGAEAAERLALQGLHHLHTPVTGVRLARLCPECGSSSHGRPVLASATASGTASGLPHVSLSRAGRVTVVALSDAGPVGVDVEPVGAAGFEGFAPVAMHAREHAQGADERTVTWVRKESLVKATGQGLTVDLTQVRVSEPSTSPALLEWSAADPPTTPVWLYDVQTATGHAAAVTVLAQTRPRLAVSREDPAGRTP